MVPAGGDVRMILVVVFKRPVLHKSMSVDSLKVELTLHCILDETYPHMG